MAEQRQTTKVVLVAVLAITLGSILVVRAGILPFGSGKSGAASNPKDKAGQTAAPNAKNGASSGNVEVRWKRPDPIGPVVSDPMRMDLSQKKPDKVQTTTVAKEEPEWRVAGIIYSTQQASSIIVDGRILHEGDIIHDAKVVKITESYAVLEQGDKTWRIQAGQTNKLGK